MKLGDGDSIVMEAPLPEINDAIFSNGSTIQDGEISNSSTFSDVESSDVIYEYPILSFRDLVRLYCPLTLIYLNHVITFSIFAFFGLVGNIALLAVILRTAGLRNAPNILLINLTIADLLYMAIATPFSILHELNPCWLYGSIACKFRFYLPLVAQAVGIFSLAALSRERYNAIVRGLESRISRSTKRTLLTVAATWIFAVIIASPVFKLTRTTTYGLMCQYLAMSQKRSKIYIIVQCLLLYFIPLSYITTNYVRLARSLCRSTTANIASNISSAANPIQARKRLAQIVLVITVLFGVLWLPYYVYFLWFIFVDDNSVSTDAKRIRNFRHFYYYMSLANSCLNPWIVFIMSSAHRRSFLQCFRRHKCDDRTGKLMSSSIRQRGLSSRVSTSSYTFQTNLSKI